MQLMACAKAAGGGSGISPALRNLLPFFGNPRIRPILVFGLESTMSLVYTYRKYERGRTRAQSAVWPPRRRGGPQCNCWPNVVVRLANRALVDLGPSEKQLLDFSDGDRALLSAEQPITVRLYPCLLARQVDQFDKLKSLSHQTIE